MERTFEVRSSKKSIGSYILNHLIGLMPLIGKRIKGNERPQRETIKALPHKPSDWDAFKASLQKTENEEIEKRRGQRDCSMRTETGDLVWILGTVQLASRKPKKKNTMLYSTLQFNQTHHRGQVHAMLTWQGGWQNQSRLTFHILACCSLVAFRVDCHCSLGQFIIPARRAV